MFHWLKIDYNRLSLILEDRNSLTSISYKNKKSSSLCAFSNMTPKDEGNGYITFQTVWITVYKFVIISLIAIHNSQISSSGNTRKVKSLQLLRGRVSKY